MSKRSIVASILAVLILAGGVYAGLLLVRQQQDLREKAAVPGGQARVSLFPTSGSFNVSDTLPVSVYFNTSGVAISSVKLRLTYPFSGTSPEVSASNIEINQIIEGSGNWNCPTKSVTTEGQNIAIDIACANVSASGFSTSTDTLLATFKLTVNQIPQANPFSLRFDPSQSIITQKSNGQDILNIPDTQTGEATFTVNQSSTTVTPSITETPSPTPTGTKTPTATPTTRLTVTPTATTSVTATPTTTSTTKGGADLPNAGYSIPTLIGLGMGTFLIVIAALLAL